MNSAVLADFIELPRVENLASATPPKLPTLFIDGMIYPADRPNRNPSASFLA
jgi:hypothetical protein